MVSTTRGRTLKEALTSERAKLIPIDCRVDDRGFLYQVYGNLGDYPLIKRVYVVGNHSRGVIRGFHKHTKEYKFFFIVSGAAKFVVEKGERNDFDTFVLSTKQPAVLVVPPGNFHGWTSMADDTTIIGMSNLSLVESEQDDIRKDPLVYGKEIWETKAR